MGAAMSTGNGAAVEAAAAAAGGAWAGTIFYAVSLFAAGMLIFSVLPPPTLLPPPPSHRLILHCRALLDRFGGPALHSHGCGQVQLAREALAAADHAVAVGIRHHPLPLVLRAFALDLMCQRRSALHVLNAALQPRLARHLLPRERGVALVKRAEINLDYYHRCIFPRPFRHSQATADLREALAISPNNACARGLLNKCLNKKKALQAGRRRRLLYLWN